MVRKTYTPEPIIAKLRVAEVRLVLSERTEPICTGLGITSQTHCRWRREFGGLKVDNVYRLKDLRREDQGLHKGVSSVTDGTLILEEAVLENTPPQ